MMETLPLKDAEDNLLTLRQRHEQGLSVFMNDSGPGRSFPGFLARFPFDGTDTVVGRCGSLDAAEGIGLPDPLRQLTGPGCTGRPGLLLGRPCLAPDLVPLPGHWNDAGFVS